MSPSPHRRAHRTLALLCGALFAIGSSAILACRPTGRTPSTPPVAPNNAPVVKDHLDRFIAATGELAFAASKDLRCEVKTDESGVAIVKVAPEWSHVEPGDLIIELDSSALEQQRRAQQALVETQRSLLIHAQNKLAAAQLARREYDAGALSAPLPLPKIATAEDDPKRLAKIQARFESLRRETKERELMRFDSDISRANAALAALQSQLSDEERKLRELEDQISKCKIRAPVAGQVVYADLDTMNLGYFHWYSGIERFNEGQRQQYLFAMPDGSVRHRQLIIKLLDTRQMHVWALIRDDQIALVKPGMPVSIRVKELPDQVISGEAMKINKNPEGIGSALSQSGHEFFHALITVLDPPPGLRSSMPVDVQILVGRQP